MAKGSAKLKAVAAPAPSRQPLTDALEAREAIKAQIADNDGAQADARAKISEIEATIEEAEKVLAAAPALERRALRKALEERKEELTDWSDHLAVFGLRDKGAGFRLFPLRSPGEGFQLRPGQPFPRCTEGVLSLGAGSQCVPA